MIDQSSCPYCDTKLNQTPQRKKKCPHCGNYIFVRRGVLFTEQQALEEDMISGWIGSLLPRGLDREEFDTRKSEERQRFDAVRMELTQQFGQSASVNDAMWRILNDQILTRTNLEDLVSLYLNMGELASSEGKDPTPYIGEAKKIQYKINVSQIEKWRGSANYVRIYTANDDYVCKNCRKLDNKRFRIEDALEKMPIPHLCTNSTGCRCYFVADD